MMQHLKHGMSGNQGSWVPQELLTQPSSTVHAPQHWQHNRSTTHGTSSHRSSSLGSNQGRWVPQELLAQPSHTQRAPQHWHTRDQQLMSHLVTDQAALAAIKADGYPKSCLHSPLTPSTLLHTGSPGGHPVVGCCWQHAHDTACLGLSPAGESPPMSEPASSLWGEVPSWSPWAGRVGLSAALHIRVRPDKAVRYKITAALQ